MGIRWCSVLGLLILEPILFVNGGLTSDFVRKNEKTIDMPLDSDVFRHPSGYNSPQQVFIFYFFILPN